MFYHFIAIQNAVPFSIILLYCNVTFTDVSCRAVWMKVLTEVEAVRLKAKCTKVFPDFINGEDLFGLTEPSIIKILESLPGVESLTDYNFKVNQFINMLYLLLVIVAYVTTTTLAKFSVCVYYRS